MSILSVFRRDNREEKLVQQQACVESGFPICLSKGLARIFGPKGKKFLDEAVMKGAFDQARVESEKDVHDLYATYMKRLASVIGESPAQVVQFESFKLMQSMLCTKCPLYEKELQRRERSSSDRFC